MKKLSVFAAWTLFLAGLVACPGFAPAQSYWDPRALNAGSGSGGAGTWDSVTTNWFNGTSDVVWAAGNIAAFAGTAGTVTLGASETADGLTFTTSGYTLTNSGSSSLTLASATITLPDGGAETVNCPLAGTTTVTISPTTSGPSALILGGINTFTGATSISGGATLTIGGAGKLNNGSYAGTITDNGAFIYNSSAVQTNSGTISGAGAMTQAGPGTLTLTHANTGFTGEVTINSGATLALTSVSGAGSTSTISNNGALTVTTAAASLTATVIGGSSSVINVNMPYNTGSENIRLDGGTTLTGFSGTINLIAGLSGGLPGAGQVIMTNNGPSTCTWNIGSGATLLLGTGTDASPYSANVILNGPGNSQPYGALRLDAVTLLGNVLLNGAGATIGDDSATAPSQISGVISDGGQRFGFTKLVSGKTVILSGANTYTGPTVFSAGTLQADSAESPGTSGPFGASPASNPGNIVLGGGTLQYSSANSNDYSGRFSANAGQAYNIDVNGQAVTFTTQLNSSGGTLTLADTAGGGALTLTGANAYNGGTTINGGTLNIPGSVAGTAMTVNNGGTLQLDNSSALPSGAILTLPSSPSSGMVNLNFPGVQNITILNFGANNPMPSGTYGSPSNPNVQNQNPAFTGNGILNVEPPTYWDPGFSASGSGSGGAGNWNSAATNWFIGTADTKWESNNIANFAGTAGTVTLTANETADGLTFDSSGYYLTNNGGVGVLILGGTPIISVPSGNAAEIDCVLAGTAGLTEAGSGALTLTGSNTFAGTMTIGSDCTLVLSGANAYTNTTTIDSGSALTLTNAGDLGDGSYPGPIVNNGTFIYGSSASQTLSGIISGTGTLTQDGPGALTLSGLNTFNGPITINNGTLTLSGVGDLNNNPTFNTGGYSGAMYDNGAFIYNSSAQQTISSAISGAGALTQSGGGTLTLSGNNSYSGVTTIGSNSDLIISGFGALGGGDYETNIINNGTFTYASSFSQTVGGVISGAGALTLSGAGTLTLTTNNTYTGATVISDGTLALSGSGSISHSSSISIAANATFDVSALSSPYSLGGSSTLSASGSATAAAIINGPSGVVNLGSQPVSLAFTPEFANGDTFHQALNIYQSALTLNGNRITVKNSGASPLGAGAYTLINVTSGTISGNATLGGVSGAGLAPNASATISVAGGSLNLVVAVVPVINSVALSGGQLVLSGANGPDNGAYNVLTSTNLALPLADWTTNATGTFSATGAFSMTNTVSVSPSFFVIQVAGP